MGLKFAHMADVHLGYEQYRLPYRAAEFREAFREAMERAVGEGVDFILIAGDLFHQSRPSPETLKDAMDILGIARGRGVPVFAIEGNHDRTQRRISAYHLLESLGYLNLIGLRDERVEGEWVTSERLGEKWLVKGVLEERDVHVEVHGIKYMSAAWLERVRLSEIFKPPANGDAVLMLHQGIKEIIERIGVIPESQRGYHEIALRDLPGGYVYYALGHIHRNYVTSYGDGTVVYSGSLQRWDFGDYEMRHEWKNGRFLRREGTEKGFYIVEDFKPRFVKLDVRPFVDVRIEGDGETVRKALETLRNKIPREAFVRLDLQWKRPYDLSEVQGLLDARYVHIRTKFRSACGRTKNGEVPSPEDYFLPVENEIIRKAGTPELDQEGIESVISLILKDLRSQKDVQNGGKGQTNKPTGEEPKKAIRGRKKRTRSADLTAWLGGG